MARKTQGTELYLINPNGDVVVAVGCVTSIDGLDASRDQIETTCLESEDRTYEAGMKTHSAFTFGLNFDPADSSHTVVEELFQSGVEVAFAIGLSDGTADPTVDSTGSEFDLPNTRTFVAFRGYVSSFPLSMPLNDVIRSTVGVQPTGPRLIARKSA
jgi:isochorismate synthase EntC